MSQIETHIEVVETAYEFLLAYAAQGREDDQGGPGRNCREVLTELDAALTNLLIALDDTVEFTSVVKDDIAKTVKALALVSAQPRISSELIDNLNASIHLRAVLTDLFLLSEAARLSQPQTKQ